MAKAGGWLAGISGVAALLAGLAAPLPAAAVECDQTLDAKLADGKTDFSAALRELYEKLPEGGGRICIPAADRPYVLEAANAQGALPTVCTPKIGVVVKKHNVWFEGVPGPSATRQRPLIEMRGLTPADVNRQLDFRSSGLEYFTVFSFVQTKGGGVRNVSFRGTNDGSEAFVHTSPRAKAVGIVASTQVTVTDVDGDRILGNVVNINPYTDNAYKECKEMPLGKLPKGYAQAHDNYVGSVVASRCLESGVNFMGNTFKSHLSNAVLWGNASAGVEAGGTGDELSGITAFGNGYAGVSLDGTDGRLSSARIYANGGLGKIKVGYGLLMTKTRNSATGCKISGNMANGLYVFECDGCSVADSEVSGNSASDHPFMKAEAALWPGPSKTRIANTGISLAAKSATAAGKVAAFSPGAEITDPDEVTVALDAPLKAFAPGSAVRIGDGSTVRAIGVYEGYGSDDRGARLRVKLTSMGYAPAVGERVVVAYGSQSLTGIQNPQNAEIEKGAR